MGVFGMILQKEKNVVDGKGGNLETIHHTMLTERSFLPPALPDFHQGGAGGRKGGKKTTRRLC